MTPATEIALASSGLPPSSPAPTASRTPKSPDEPVPEIYPVASPLEDRTRYRLDASLDYRGHTLEVEEQISYTNTTPEILEKIPLVVEALRYPGTFALGKIIGANGERILQHRDPGDDVNGVPCLQS